MARLNQILILNKLKENKLKIFSILDFQRIFDINYDLAKKITFRYAQKGIFTKLKKGLYFITETHPSNFEIANKLYFPSYISFDTALSFYGLIPETIYEITSATTLAPKEFIVSGVKFSYKKIKKDCFFGYIPQKIGESTILIAEPEKALVDFFYFVALGKREFNYERLHFKKVKKKKVLEIAKRFKNKKLLTLLKNLL